MAAPIVSAARAAPIAWSALVAASQQPSRFAMAITRRTAEQTALYSAWKAEVAAKAAEDPPIGYSIEAAIIGKLTGSWRPLSPTSTCLVSLLPNDFPYNVEPGVAHAVLWLERGEGLSQEEALAAATRLAADGTGRPRERESRALWWGAPGAAREVLAFENPTAARSVKMIRHFQVFMRPAVRAGEGAGEGAGARVEAGWSPAKRDALLELVLGSGGAADADAGVDWEAAAAGTAEAGSLFARTAGEAKEQWQHVLEPALRFALAKQASLESEAGEYEQLFDEEWRGWAGRYRVARA